MKLVAVLLALVMAGCARQVAAPAPAADAGTEVARSPAPAVAPPKAPARPPPSTATPEEIARARALVDKGVKLYREGLYAQAEDVLKQGITLYPFMADANLVLAKILLIRASATRDMTLYTNARLMLEMARALDPGSREVEQLLELVRQPTAE
jgi:TolA-binding protein